MKDAEREGLGGDSTIGLTLILVLGEDQGSCKEQGKVNTGGESEYARDKS